MIENFKASLECAKHLDKEDSLAPFKSWFYFPQYKNKNAIYFCGNSLGLQPTNVEAAIHTELEAWKSLAAQAYFKGRNPWLYYQEYLKPSLAKIVGANEQEVSVMNALTVNLHLLMLSFYKPSRQRYKIIMEAGAFPSDQYAVQTQVAHHGLQYDDAVIEVSPRAGEKIIHEEDILNVIEKNKNELAMLLFGGIHYYTGQLFDIKKITTAVHEAGAIVGWDLAHAAGNVPMHLHEWSVDFAAWCSYKYLNAGPGAAAGFFVHEKFAKNNLFHRLGGWWGNDEQTRFRMEYEFVPKKNASGWNISTAQVFNMVALKASLEIFDKTNMQFLRKKSEALTAYLEFLLKQLDNTSFEIITPAEVHRRGAQLSLHFKKNGKIIHDKMIESGIIIDYREPGVVRVAPAPLYCSFEDCFYFFEILKKIFSA